LIWFVVNPSALYNTEAFQVDGFYKRLLSSEIFVPLAQLGPFKTSTPSLFSVGDLCVVA
jgi:hypothetical protein